MIRQAISCDVCGIDKKQSTHWFVAYECQGDLRISGWNARSRPRPDARHLCGPGCLHKLLDDYLQRVIARPAQASASASCTVEVPQIGAGYREDSAPIESSARLLSAVSQPVARAPANLVPMGMRIAADSTVPPLGAQPAARNRRIAAWERERERMMRPGRAAQA